MSRCRMTLSFYRKKTVLKPFLRKKRLYQKNLTCSRFWYGIANTEVLFAGVMLVLFAAMLRTAYEGVSYMDDEKHIDCFTCS
jgi:hypothetical protein